MTSNRTLLTFFLIVLYGAIWSLKLAITGNPGNFFIASPAFRFLVGMYVLSVIYDCVCFYKRQKGRKKNRLTKNQKQVDRAA